MQETPARLGILFTEEESLILWDIVASTGIHPHSLISQAITILHRSTTKDTSDE
jgi:hypothetical protein